MQRFRTILWSFPGTSREEVLQTGGTIRVCNYNIAVNCERTTQRIVLKPGEQMLIRLQSVQKQSEGSHLSTGL